MFSLNQKFNFIIHPRMLFIIAQNNLKWIKVSGNVQYCPIKEVNLNVNIMIREKFFPIKVFNCCINHILFGFTIMPYPTGIKRRMFYFCFQIKLEQIIWWWHLGWRVRWTPEPIIKFGWFVEIRSIQLEEFSKTWSGSMIRCFISYNEEKDSNWALSVIGWSLISNVFDFAFKIT